MSRGIMLDYSDELELQSEAEKIEQFAMTSLGKLIFVDIHSRHPKSLSADKPSIDLVDSLSLAFESLFCMPFDIIENYGNSVHTLDVSHNKFSRNLQFLAEFENLTSLNLDHNNIDDHTVFPHMPKLQLLWLNHNNIEDLYPFIKNLYESVPNLRYLCLMGNKAAPSYLNGGSFYDYLQYRYEQEKQIAKCYTAVMVQQEIFWRLACTFSFFSTHHRDYFILFKKRLFVISWFPHLLHLDDRTVTPEQRQEAKRLFKRPFLENLTEHAPLPECIKHLHNKITNMFSKPTLPEKLKVTGGSNVII